ncbi:MAG: MFS transporter [Oscillospiraceae bacterium]|nr:MFS transporter [Oscillospiraceae bacterium]
MKQHSTPTLKLLNKNFIALMFSYAFALLGYYLLNFALPIYILYATGSPVLFGGVSALALLPMVLMSPIGGLVADRANKKKIIAVLQLCNAVLIFLFIWLSGLLSIIPMIIILMLGISGLEGLVSPAIDSGMPQIVPEAQIVRGSGMMSVMGQVPEFIAPIAAGMLLTNVGLQPIVIISGICYVLAAIMGAVLKIPHVKQGTSGEIVATVKADVNVTVHFLRHENRQMLRAALALAALGLVMFPIIPIGMPILLYTNLGFSSEMLGFAMGGAIGVGGIISGLIASAVGDKLKMKDCPKLILFECALMVPIGLVFLLNLDPMVSLFVITISIMLIMITASLLMVRFFGYIQVVTPEGIMGKVISIITVFTMWTHPMGLFLYGVMFERFQGAPWAVIFLAAAASLGIALYAAQHFRRMDT